MMKLKDNMFSVSFHCVQTINSIFYLVYYFNYSDLYLNRTKYYLFLLFCVLFLELGIEVEEVVDRDEVGDDKDCDNFNLFTDLSFLFFL